MLSHPPKHPYISAQNGGTGNGLAWTRKAEPLLELFRMRRAAKWNARERARGLTPEEAADRLAAIAAQPRQQTVVQTTPGFYPAYAYTASFYPAGSVAYPYGGHFFASGSCVWP